MYLLLVSVFFNFFVLNTALTDRGAFSWKKFGSTVNGRIAGGNGGVTVSSSGSFSLLQQYEPRVNLMDSTTSYTKLPDLKGNTICFTVDLSKTTCSCNAALYLVEMPSGSTPDFYCDAQGGSSGPCVEFDMIEANTHAFQATAHWGDGSTNGKNGCAWNIKSAQGYGSGGSLIDSSKPFTVCYSFTKSSSGTFNGIKIHLTQSGKSGISNTLTDSYCSGQGLGSNYISSLAAAVSSGRNVVVGSYWSSNMNWLDGCSSSGSTCPTSSTITFSSFQLISGVTAITADESSNGNELPFVQSPLFIGIMCAVGLLLLVGVITFILIRRKNALSQEIV